MVDLGLSVAEFWDLTPRAFVKMCKRFEANERHADYRAAVMALPLVNWGVTKETEHKAKQAGDLFPSLRPKPKRVTAQDQAAALRAWASIGAGTMVTTV